MILSGSEANFHVVNSRLGCKFFRDADQNEVKAIYNQQKLAAEHGLAPKVYGMCKHVDENGKTYFGYYTEIAETPFVTSNKHNHVVTKQFFNDEQRKVFQELQDLLLKIGIKTSTVFDLFECNIGYIRGKMVCIDFGHI